METALGIIRKYFVKSHYVNEALEMGKGLLYHEDKVLLAMEEYKQQEVKKNLSHNPVLSADSPLTIEAIDFGNWLGFHYYRVNGWKWRQLKDESDITEYPLVVLYDKFKRETKR